MNTDTLENAFQKMPSPKRLPSALPIAHTSIVRWFEGIVNDGTLRPMMCKYFKEEVLYLFYGAFYQPSNKVTRNVSELPIGFLFHPAVLSKIERYYPFDSGAICSGRVGQWSDTLSPIHHKYRVMGNSDYTVPSKMVHHLFGSNDNYLSGILDQKCEQKPEPIPELVRFYNEDLTKMDVDRRQCIIECQILDGLLLDRDLIWIAFPLSKAELYCRICAKTSPHIPMASPYICHNTFNPANIAAMIEDRARNIIQRYANFDKIEGIKI
jgi:hypothetical protein